MDMVATMVIENHIVDVEVPGPGLYEITGDLNERLKALQVESGLMTLFIQHTSASLLIQENADPSAKRDLEVWLNRLVPENDVIYSHVAEGADDMPAHIKAMLTAVNLSIPISKQALVLGTWQGVFLWEHRRAMKKRQIVLNVVGR